MRLLKFTQSIVFLEDAFQGIFKKGQEVTFSGYLDSNYSETFTGYMKQAPVDKNSLTLCIKGHLENVGGNELILIQTTTVSSVPITMCSYFPSIYNNKGTGYLDGTDGVPSNDGKYFFISGNYIAKTTIHLEGFEDVLPNDTQFFNKIGNKKRRHMFSRLYFSNYTDRYLHKGFLFNYIQPHWCGAHRKLIHTNPKKTQ